MEPLGEGFCLEIFAKNTGQLSEQLPLLSEVADTPGFCGFNLPNKTSDDPLHEMVSMLRQAIPTAKICMHYSCAYRKQSLPSVLESCPGVDSILVVSGSRPKKNRDSVAVLRDVSSAGARLGVAFNPYGGLSHELCRLEMKMKCEHVKEVWLQIGTNLQMLEDALRELRAKHPNLHIYGSVLLPTPQQLQQWRFRPWSGTSVEASALESVEAFRMAMQGCIQLLWQYGATPLIETRVTRNNMSNLKALIGSSSDEVTRNPGKISHACSGSTPDKRSSACLARPASSEKSVNTPDKRLQSYPGSTPQPKRRWMKKATLEK